MSRPDEAMGQANGGPGSQRGPLSWAPSSESDAGPARAATEAKPKLGTHLLHRSLAVPPSMVESAQGVELRLSEGRTIIDGCAGAAVSIIGHGNEEVHAAMMQQASKAGYVHTQAYTTAAAEELADFLLQGNPHRLDKVFFVGSGSEAVESALKLARQYHFESGELERVHILSRRQSYHGSTLGAMSVSHHLARRAPFEAICYPHVSHLTPPYGYRYRRQDESEAEFGERLLRELEAEIVGIGPGRVMAFIAETVMGATAGCVTAPAGYYKGVRALCDRYGILLILDEVMSGTGRTGTFFAFEQEGIVPDIVTAAKGLGGGYGAMAAIYIHKRVVDVLRRGSKSFNHGHTYQSHPIACAAALAVQRIVRREGLVERCRQMGRLLGQLLESELGDCRCVGDIRGRGLFWAVEFVSDRQTKEPFAAEVGFGARVQQAAFRAGVAVYPGAGTADGLRGDHVLLAPPLTVTEEQLRTVCRVLRQAVCETEAAVLTAAAATP